MTVKSLTELFPEYFLVSVFHKKVAELKGYISFYKGSQGLPFFGATRIWSYADEHDALLDSTKLAKIMTYKSLMAGYTYGGAKAVIISPQNRTDEWLSYYAALVNFFHGSFITGADVGMSEQELSILAGQSKYIMGIKSEPIPCTIHGIFAAVNVVSEKILMKPKLNNLSIAIQGLGKIGLGLLELAKEYTSTIYISDINQELVHKVSQQYPQVTVVEPERIHALPVDIFSPCALSGVLNSTTVNQLQCKAIVGSANSQLEHEEIGELLHKQGVFYAPDYIVNAGGFIAVAEEYKHEHTNNNTMQLVQQKITENLSMIIEKSIHTSQSPSSQADSYVLQKMEELHWT